MSEELSQDSTVEKPCVLTWDEIEPAAKAAFDVWIGNPELQWAKEAWGYLTAAGLASYSNPVERTQAVIRLLSLATIYLDWCTVAHQEMNEDCFTKWIEDLEEPIRPNLFWLGVLLAKEVRADPDLFDDEDDDELLESALGTLAYKHRDEILRALFEGLGKGLSESGKATELFVSLWKSQWEVEDTDSPYWEEDEDGDPIRVDEATLRGLILDATLDDFDKHAGFAWISNGCPAHPVEGR